MLLQFIADVTLNNALKSLDDRFDVICFIKDKLYSPGYLLGVDRNVSLLYRRISKIIYLHENFFVAHCINIQWKPKGKMVVELVTWMMLANGTVTKFIAELL